MAIRLADRLDHTIFILGCPHCGIPFITKNSNFGRRDVLCSFNCRQNKKKANARKRSKKYYQNPINREKKKKLNRSRSLVNNTPNIVPPPKTDPFILYTKLLTESLLKKMMEVEEFIVLEEKVRSRGLLFYQKLIHYSDYG